MSIKIESKTSPDVTIQTAASAPAKEVSSQTVSVQSTDKVTLSSEGVELSKSVEGTATKKTSGVLPPPDIAAFEADAALPRAELYAKYEKAVSSLNFQTQEALDRANAAVPDNDDPARLAQAKQATAYVFNKGPSPFPALSRNELAAIYYDYSGRYTPNERIAAVKKMNEMDTQFWGPLVAEASVTGDQRPVLEAGLAAYDAALPIEKMKSPADHKQLIYRELANANNKAHEPLDKKKMKTLLEMLEEVYHKQKKKDAADKTPVVDSTRDWSKVWAGLALDGKESASANNARISQTQS